ncbi:MAG TPA: hypothetical protein VMT58_02510 [Candidatus Binataceae bacterium]|nr:hypothetical protein [Candidatus Binataceae bacterium]
MKRTKSLCLVLIAAGCMAASGCVVIESSVIGGKLGPGSAISATASDYGILRLSVPAGLTEAAKSNLFAQCASSKVSGVSTELQMRDFFFVQSYTVTAGGFCQ